VAACCGKAALLAVTSFATRTSPIIRGVWSLGSIFGAPPPPPLPNVPSLDESTVSASLRCAERLAAHRSNAVCASCHRTIDPVGFSLESFNAVGQWRDHEADDVPIDVSGALPGVGELRGVAGLEDGLLSRPELFTGTLTEKLLTFALGRGIEYYDAPAVRTIVRDAERPIPLLVAHPGHREERAVSDEEIIMIITKKAIPRRTFLRGAKAALALPLLDAMIPAATAWAKTPARPVPRLGFVFIPMGCDHGRWTPPGGAKLTELSPHPVSARTGQRPADRHDQHASAECLTGHA